MTKTTTTTRDYDENGRMIRETIIEHDTPSASAPICTCAYNWTSGYYYCAVHGYYGISWTSGGMIQTNDRTYTINTNTAALS